ncbi:pilus assembly protein PilP [Alginatibacterium sediminis]|nr:pilus assembly protein PilP [Alginatibacterium sediminis]
MNKSFLVVVSTVLLLSACGGQNDDLQQYALQVKARQVPIVDDVPELIEYAHLAYVAPAERHPFTLPQAEFAEAKEQEKSEVCEIEPPQAHEQSPLEQYSLINLKMRGVLGKGNQLWALVQSPDGEMYRIDQGYYIGLNQGQVTGVKPDGFEVLEIIPDGKGCWTHRSTTIELTQAQ